MGRDPDDVWHVLSLRAAKRFPGHDSRYFIMHRYVNDGIIFRDEINIIRLK